MFWTAVVMHLDQDSDVATRSQVQDSFASEIADIQADLIDHLCKLGSENSRYVKFNKHLKVHNERVKSSVNILHMGYSGNEDEMKSNILEFARKSQTMMKRDDSDVMNIHKHWKVVNDRLQDNLDLFPTLQEYGIKKKKMKLCSIYIFLEAESVQHLDSFWEEYVHGSLTEKIQHQLCKGHVDKDVDSGLSLYISEENYTAYRKYLGKLLLCVLHSKSIYLTLQETHRLFYFKSTPRTKINLAEYIYSWRYRYSTDQSKGRLTPKRNARNTPYDDWRITIFKKSFWMIINS